MCKRRIAGTTIYQFVGQDIVRHQRKAPSSMLSITAGTGLQAIHIASVWLLDEQSWDYGSKARRVDLESIHSELVNYASCSRHGVRQTDKLNFRPPDLRMAPQAVLKIRMPVGCLLVMCIPTGTSKPAQASSSPGIADSFLVHSADRFEYILFRASSI